MGKSKELAELGNAVTQSGGTTTFSDDTTAIVSTQSGSITLQNYAYATGFTYDLSNASQAHSVGTSSSAPTILKTGNVERMRIDASGRVTMPYQPAFRAGLSTGNSQDSSQPYTYTGVIAWDQIQVNRGSYYSSSNGRFTAPVAGCYCFHMSALLASGTTGNGGMRFVLNGTALDAPIPYTYATGNFVFLSASTVVNMNANDWVGVENYGGHSLHINPVNSNEHNGFSGFLIG